MEQEENAAVRPAGPETGPETAGPDTAGGAPGTGRAEPSAGESGMPPEKADGKPDETESLRRRYAELQAKYDAETANRANAQAALGSVSGGDAVERDYYTSQEWDRLPEHLRRKFIKNGRIFDFMKKWSEKI